MSEYEELIKNLRSVKDTWQTQEEEWMLQAADAIEKLMTLPAADVKPVVKGEWIDKGYHEEWTFECSVCGGCSPEEYDFCPHCGADMREEGKTMSEYPDKYDICYECSGYGDDYSTDENGELVWNCPNCPFNPLRKEANDEID